MVPLGGSAPIIHCRVRYYYAAARGDNQIYHARAVSVLVGRVRPPFRRDCGWVSRHIRHGHMYCQMDTQGMCLVLSAWDVHLHWLVTVTLAAFQTLMGTRTRLIFTLVFLAYPFFAIGLGTVIMTFGEHM